MKICKACNLEKETNQFSKKVSSKDGLQSWCNSCVGGKMRERYQSNKRKWYELGQAQKANKRNWVDEYKHRAGCLVCLENEPCCLDFHHVFSQEKESDVSRLIERKCSDAKIQSEIEKCLVVCARCHRKIHYGLIAIEILR